MGATFTSLCTSTVLSSWKSLLYYSLRVAEATKLIDLSSGSLEDIYGAEKHLELILHIK